MSVKLLCYTRGLEEGGSEKRVERLAYGLHSHRFQVTVGYSETWGPVGDRLLTAGIPVQQIPAKDLPCAQKMIRRIAPDIFHSFAHKDAVEIAAAAAAEVPVIVASRVNVREWDERGEVQPWELERNRQTHRITAVSHAAALVCRRVEGVAPENITVIHSGVPIPEPARHLRTIRDELGVAPHVQLIGYVANYRPVKDHENLLAAFRRVLDHRPDTHLVCCGILPAETGARLREAARRLAIEAKVSLLDSRSELRGVYEGLDLAIHPSLLEGLANSLLEAMSHRLAVVAVRSGGTPEAVVDGVNGLLTPPGQPAAFADAVISLLGDPDRLEAFATAGRERAARCFSLDRMLQSYASFYDEMCAWGRGASRVSAAG